MLIGVNAEFGKNRTLNFYEFYKLFFLTKNFFYFKLKQVNAKKGERIMKKQTLILFVLFMSFIVSFSGCKKSEEANVFDIRGTWGAVYIVSNQNFTGTLTFSGNVANGTVSDGTWSGTYVVNGNSVTFSLDITDTTYGRTHWSHSGSATDDNHMSGNFIITYLDLSNQQVSGTWTCNR